MGGGGGSSVADFGRWLRRARDAAQLTQEGLAERSGVSVRTIQTLEAGQIRAPRQATRRKLRQALGAEDGQTRPAVDRAVPAQLPLDVFGFVGRQAELARLDGLLESPAVPVAAVLGTAGVGKTTLAVHWAHQVRHRFPDGQLYVDLRGFDPQDTWLSPGRAVCWLLDGLGVPPDRVPADDAARFAVYRSLLAGRRMLVVLDNAASQDQVRSLLPGTRDSVVLVTSRSRLPSLVAAGACPVVLDLLSQEEAGQLLTHRLGAEVAAADPDVVEEIATSCARLPLALVIAAANAVTNPALPLRSLAAELADRRYCLDALSTGTASTDLRAAFSCSYRAVEAPAARLFRLLGLCRGLPVPVPAAASLAQVDVVTARRLLTELAGVHLVDESAPGRFGMHRLLQAYAAELAAGYGLDPGLA